MSSHEGQALIITEDDAKVTVIANLSGYQHGLRSGWGGTLAPSSDDLRQLLNLTSARLRLPEGTEAAFLRPETSDWVSTKRLTIIDQGEAPF
jgi:hypothetical protein